MPGAFKQWKKLLAEHWLLFSSFIILVLLIIGFTRTLYQNYQIQQEISRLQSEAARLEAKKVETLNLLKYVQSSAYVEEKARTELNLVKPGEHALIITDRKPNDGQANASVVKSERSNLAKWWQYFFK